jgi:transcriptional regulator with XRE-family HTH domain
MFSDAYRSMLEVLVAARRERGLTQTDVAAALGKHQSFIAKIEGGERRLDVIEFCAIADALDVDAAELLSTVRKALPSTLSI